MTNELELKEKMQDIINGINNSKTEFKVLCKDGYVSIPSNNLFCWTYAGQFGSLVCSSQTKVKYDNLTERIALLAAHVLNYSSKVSGINFIAVN